MEITILLTVSRPDFLERVITAIEMQDINPRTTGILAIVDGSEELFIKTRNILNETKYEENLTVMFSEARNIAPRYDIMGRRKRIAALHNQARGLIGEHTKWVFSVEDDTIIPKGAIKKLADVAFNKRSIGQVTGVELGRWGVPYVGAWSVNDIYEPTSITSIQNATDYPDAIETIDACGLYCSMIRADLYKQHNFTSHNGLGPDINLSIELRQLGYQNFIHWGVHCIHMTKDNNAKEEHILATDESSIVQLSKLNEQKWTQRVLES